MTLTLTLTDNADGTGILATIAGSDVASTNTVYTSPVAQGNGVVWTSQGSRTGDGTLTLAVPPAYYYVFVAGTVSSAPAVSVPVIGVASLAVQSIQEQCELAAQARIQGLTLAGLSTPPGTLPASRVLHFSTPLSDDVMGLLMTLPCIAVAPARVPESVEGILTGVDDIGYPVQVAIIDRAGSRDQGPPQTYKLWRQQIFRALRFQRLTVSGGAVYVLKPEPQPVLTWEGPKYDFMVSGLVFRAVSREPRG